MPKILHVIPSLKFGGEERFLLDIYQFLDTQFEQTVCPFLHAGELYNSTLHLDRYQNHSFWLFIFKSKKRIVTILKPYLLFFYHPYRAYKIIHRDNPTMIVSYTVQAAIAIYIAKFFSRKKQFFWCARIGNQMDHPALFQKIFRNKWSYPFSKMLVNSV